MQGAGGRGAEKQGSGGAGVRDLSRVRDGWDEIEAEEACLLRQMTVQESLRHLLTLQFPVHQCTDLKKHKPRNT